MAPPTFAATNIPFTYAQGMIWLKVSVQGSAQPMDFLLDTGASRTLLSIRAANRLGLAPGRPFTMSAILGPSTAYRISATAIFAQNIPLSTATVALDTDRFTGALGHAVDGLIGADFFYRHAIQINYQDQLIRIEDPGKQSYFPADVADLSLRNGAICVKASVNGGQPALFRIDTGCGSAVEWCQAQSQFAATTTAAASSPSSNPLFRSITKIGITVGARQFDHIEAGLHNQPMFPGESGLIGNGLLSRCVITIDAPNQRLYMADPN